MSGRAGLIIGAFGALALHPGSRKSKVDITTRQAVPAVADVPGVPSTKTAPADIIQKVNTKFVQATTPITRVAFNAAGKKIRKFELDPEYSIGEFSGGSLKGKFYRGHFESPDLKPVTFCSDESIKSFPEVY